MVNFLLKCSFLEIYNEHVYDLLDNTSTVLNIPSFVFKYLQMSIVSLS